jgi:hypothetical protein
MSSKGASGNDEAANYIIYTVAYNVAGIETLDLFFN